LRFIYFLILVLSPLIGSASERVALVIGMAKYETVVPLDNTVNDAISITNTLESIGFDVRMLTDVSSEELRRAVDDFAFKSETADLALIYFAGHGVEVQGQNFLIPVDADVRSNKDIQRQSVSLKQLLAAAGSARKMRVVILDSCRDNPFGDALDLEALVDEEQKAEKTRSLAGGLAKPSPDRGTLVAFAAKDGQKALDGIGKNSPFALALIDNLPKPNLEISLLFRQVRDSVLETTRNQQEPHTYGSLSGIPYYLAGSEGNNTEIGNDDLRVAWSEIQPDQESQLVNLASQGDTRSMIGLAYIRLNADDKRYAPSKAAQYLILAADEGSAEAQFELAKLYEAGLGVEQDIDRALDLYEASAAADFPDALNDLGFLYFQGSVGRIQMDQRKAVEYFKRAADLKQPQAMFNYAALIDDGVIEGSGPSDAAHYLYKSLRTGSRQVLQILTDKPKMFKEETLKELQKQLTTYAFYSGPIDGDFGPQTQSSIRVAFGLLN
jgi:uncharacterized caspase-like protein